MLLAGLQDVGHEDVTTGCGVFSLRSFIKATSALFVIRLRLLAPRDISVAAAGEKERSPFAPPLMLVGADQSPQHYSSITFLFLGILLESRV